MDNPGILDIPQVVDDWPGNRGGEKKVPTALAKRETEATRKWGFLCNELDEDKTWRFFKPLLGPVHSQSRRVDIATESEQKDPIQAATEYLRQIYCHNRITIPKDISRKCFGYIEKLRGAGWDDWEVEFIFSVPTTWKTLDSQRRFGSIVHNAGFGKGKHKAVLGFTEAEAAAVAMVMDSESAIRCDENDIFLSVDAGGGTTDLAFIRIVSADTLKIDQVQDVSGDEIGSMLIDMGFMQLVDERLQKYPQFQ